MAATLKVKVHPVVHMTIVDSYERRSTKPGSDDKALGTLLGYYEKNAIVVTNAFAIPFSEQIEDTPELDATFNQQMLQMLKRSSPSEQPVGWFYTNADLSSHCVSYHDYYNRLIAESAGKKDPPPVVLLTLDVSLSSDGPDAYRMPIRAYIRTKGGIPGSREPHCAIFNPLKVELDAYPGEAVALQLVQKGIGNKQREVSLDHNFTQLEQSIEQMMHWLKRLKVYVDGVLSEKELPIDTTLGRRIMEIVNAATLQLKGDKFESVVKNSLREYMMISYLAKLTEAQINLNRKVINI